MKIKLNKRKIQGLSIVLGAAIVGMAWLFTAFLVPVGTVNGQIIYRYQLNSRLRSMSDNTVKNLAKDMVYFKDLEKLGIAATDSEIEDGLKSYEDHYGGKDELQNILIDTKGDMESLKLSVKKEILNNKAINYFAERQVVTDEEVKEFYESNKDNYGGDFVAMKETIKKDLQLDKGREEYNEYLGQIEESTKILIY